jgi:hypothetical protein
MSIKTALGAFGVSMLAASAAMAGGLGDSDNALNDYVTNIQGADQMSAKQMEETKGTLLPIPDYSPSLNWGWRYNYDLNCFNYACDGYTIPGQESAFGSHY